MEYKHKKIQEERELHNQLLRELEELDLELFEENDLELEFTEKINSKLLDKRKGEEFEKLRSISGRINETAKNILKQWEKDGICLLDS